MLSAPDHRAGKHALCPGCKQKLTVPALPEDQLEEVRESAFSGSKPPAVRPGPTEAPVADRRVSRLPLILGGAAAACALLVLLACTGGFFAFLMYGGADHLLHPERGAVLDYLKKNMNDPDSLEIVEWGNPRHYVAATSRQDPNFEVTVVYVRMRGKNAFGAKIVNTMKFDVKSGKVIRAEPADEMPSD
jgi:hypothetical protein